MPKRPTKSLRAAIRASMSVGGQCEDPHLSLDAIAVNNAQWHLLEQRVKIALSQPYKGAAREHIPSKQEGKLGRRAVAARKDKKHMAYRK